MKVTREGISHTELIERLEYVIEKLNSEDYKGILNTSRISFEDKSEQYYTIGKRVDYRLKTSIETEYEFYFNVRIVE